MKKYTWTFIVAAVSGMLFCLSFMLATEDNPSVIPAVEITTPTATSSIVWYTSIPQTDANRIANAFKTQTGIGVEIVRDSAFSIRDRLLSDIANGENKADVLTIADIATYTILKNQGHFLNYASPEYVHYADEYKDEGYWAVFAAFGICMAYDENRIDDPPLQWTDLLDSRWQGRIGLENINTAGSQYGQYYMLREILGVEFWEALLTTQHPRIYSSTTALADALVEGEIDIAGEFSIQTVYSYRNAKGVSIQGIYPTEGIPLVVNPTAILAQTQRPEEARLFQDFLLSMKGQEIMQITCYKYSVREDVASLDGIPELNSLNILLPADAELYGSKREEYVQEFNSFLGGTQ
jgi:iron(III) transport system substrate-binding protein